MMRVGVLALLALVKGGEAQGGGPRNGTRDPPSLRVPPAAELMANCPRQIRACIATHGCMATLAHELEWAANNHGALCMEPGQCSPEVRAIAESCRPFAPHEEEDEQRGPLPCGFLDFMGRVHQVEHFLFHDIDEEWAMQIANATEIARCAAVLIPGTAVSPRCGDPDAPTGPKNCEFAELVDCWNRWDRGLTPMYDKWAECKPLMGPCEHAYGTMLGAHCQMRREEEVVYAQVALGLDIDAIMTMSDYDYNHFVGDLESDLAALLGIDAGRVEVVDIEGGSIIVTFSVRHDEYGRLPPAHLFEHLHKPDAQFPKIQYVGHVDVIDVWVATEPADAEDLGMGDNEDDWHPGMGDCYDDYWGWIPCDCYDEFGNRIPCEPYDPGMWGPSAEPHDPGMWGPSAEPYDPGTGGCNPDTAVCVESDLAIMQGADIESLTPGCQCCFMSHGDDLSVDPFVPCLAHLFPQADFCADPGNAQSNPDAMTYECRHVCENWDAPEEELEAAGCYNDEHEDEICVTERVYAPGEMQPWGEACCSWCEDWDGDGDPDYQGCCEGMRADGEMGCEDRGCEWMCNGASCFEHGEDQATCEDNDGTWVVGSSCADQIAMQGVWQMTLEQEGMGADVAAIFWLGENGDVCCTGYEPAGSGSCDDDIDSFVSVSIACVAL